MAIVKDYCIYWDKSMRRCQSAEKCEKKEHRGYFTCCKSLGVTREIKLDDGRDK